MAKGVNESQQEGCLYIWQYADPNSSWRGWQFSADPLGCRSIRNLLDRMQGSNACYRTLKLDPITNDVLSVPNYSHKIDKQFAKLRVEYVPSFENLEIKPNENALILKVGTRRVHDLSSAFAKIETGDGDFGIRTSDAKRSEIWMFWWAPNINYWKTK
jgi:hypothetical protein